MIKPTCHAIRPPLKQEFNHLDLKKVLQTARANVYPLIECQIQVEHFSSKTIVVRMDGMILQLRIPYSPTSAH